MQGLRGWRTIAINVGIAMLLVTDYLVAAHGVFPQLLEDPRHATLAVVAVNVINILLRVITTGPVGGQK